MLANTKTAVPAVPAAPKPVCRHLLTIVPGSTMRASCCTPQLTCTVCKQSFYYTSLPKAPASLAPAPR
jgi:hypothetical protein